MTEISAEEARNLSKSVNIKKDNLKQLALELLLGYFYEMINQACNNGEFATKITRIERSYGKPGKVVDTSDIIEAAAEALRAKGYKVRYTMNRAIDCKYPYEMTIDWRDQI